MSKHILHGSAECPCNHRDEYNRCMVCDGGLALCVVCHGAEGSMPTECPGVRMTGEQTEAVYDQVLDFKDGAWCEVQP